MNQVFCRCLVGGTTDDSKPTLRISVPCCSQNPTSFIVAGIPDLCIHFESNRCVNGRDMAADTKGGRQAA